MEQTVAFVPIIEKKEIHIVLDVVRLEEDLFGVNVNYTPAQ